MQMYKKWKNKTLVIMSDEGEVVEFYPWGTYIITHSLITEKTVISVLGLKYPTMFNIIDDEKLQPVGNPDKLAYELWD